MNVADALRAQAAVLLALADEAEREPAPGDAGELVALANAGPPIRTLRLAVRRGELAAMRVGRSYMIRRADLAAWLQARAVKPRPAVRREPTTPAERAIERARRDGSLRLVGSR